MYESNKRRKIKHVRHNIHKHSHILQEHKCTQINKLNKKLLDIHVIQTVKSAPCTNTPRARTAFIADSLAHSLARSFFAKSGTALRRTT
jgi:hypothetical protein